LNYLNFLVRLGIRVNLVEKYKIKPRINPPSIKPKIAPVKRLRIFKTGRLKILLTTLSKQIMINWVIIKIRIKDNKRAKFKLSLKKGSNFKATVSYHCPATKIAKTRPTIPPNVRINPFQKPNQTKPNKSNNKIKSNKLIIKLF